MSASLHAQRMGYTNDFPITVKKAAAQTRRAARGPTVKAGVGGLMGLEPSVEPGHHKSHSRTTPCSLKKVRITTMVMWSSENRRGGNARDGDQIGAYAVV